MKNVDKIINALTSLNGIELEEKEYVLALYFNSADNKNVIINSGNEIVGINGVAGTTNYDNTFQKNEHDNLKKHILNVAINILSENEELLKTFKLGILDIEHGKINNPIIN